MDTDEIIKLLHGLIKKHGRDFSLNIKYLTAADKIDKRHGTFVDLVDDAILVLYSPEKKSHGRYEVGRILEIRKR